MTSGKVHPSRRGLISQPSLPLPAPAPPPLLSIVQIRTLSQLAQQPAPVVMGSQEMFNRMRIQFIEAAGMQRWLYSRDQIDWHAIPVCQDAEAMADLERRNLIGLYWFTNHADSKGSLSCGQVYDILVSLAVVSKTIKWDPAIYNQLTSLLTWSLNNSAGICYEFAPPPITAENVATILAKVTSKLEPYDPSNPGI